VMLLEMADNALNGGTRFELALDLNCDAALRAWKQRERHWLRCDACFVPAAGCCCGSTPAATHIWSAGVEASASVPNCWNGGCGRVSFVT
jgi:hypothetical protein